MKPQMRTFNEIVGSLLFPFTGIGGPSPEVETRVSAAANVLQRIPDKAYRVLCDKADDFVWFIPEASMEGMVREFPCTAPETDRLVARAKIFYLSPNLELRDPMFVIAVVAHEFAHIFLGHNAGRNDEGSYERQEQEAWRTVAAWGFEKEKRNWEKTRAKEAREDAREIEKIKRVLKRT